MPLIEHAGTALVLADGSAVGDETQFNIHPDDVEQLLAIFSQLDLNGDGTVSRAEIIKAMRTEQQVPLGLGYQALLQAVVCESVFRCLDHCLDWRPRTSSRKMGLVQAWRGFSKQLTATARRVCPRCGVAECCAVCDECTAG